MKEKGVLLPIFSLPSKYGIGDFGYEAFEFIDILSENKIQYWEILPINACRKLPYSSISYYALNEDYISLDKLKDMKLIKKLKKRRNKSNCNYDDFKKKYYKEAFKNFEETDEYKEFISFEPISQYAEYKSRILNESKEYFLFLQYILYKQWMELKNYANSKNVKIIGDMPFYPMFDSTETYYNPGCFEFDQNGDPIFEGGAPPDFYNSDGQKWGCPVYNINNIRKNNFEYLLKRFEYFSKLFDKIRLDYFIGYNAFFRIPIGKACKEGEYSEGPGYEFFDRLLNDSKIELDKIIIEDLGDIKKETIELREHYGFTRQKIFQFSFDFENGIDSDADCENMVIFPANHDCSTIYSWYRSLDNEKKKKLKQFLKENECNNKNINCGIIQYCLKCKAKITIVLMQDILGLDNKSRINVPGTVSDKNWTWKLKNFNEVRKKIKTFKREEK